MDHSSLPVKVEGLRLWLQLACHTLLESGLAGWQPWLVLWSPLWMDRVGAWGRYVYVVMVRSSYIKDVFYAVDMDFGG